MSTIEPTQELTLSLSVKNRAVTAEWFKKHLGFAELFSVEEAGWTELSTNIPGVVIGLGDADEISPGNCVPVFGVADVDTARDALEREAVNFDGDTMTIEGMVKLATFYDPDGNALMIAEDLSKSG